MSGFPEQEKIDLYYKNKKNEVSQWLVEYTNNLKRLSKIQREKMLNYAKQICFGNSGELIEYVQQLKNIGKKDKKLFIDYMETIEWLPEGVRSGILDGQIVTKIIPNELDLFFEKAKMEKK